jgi:prepilin-type N-terminal cleavage/methylation domain-containing protein
MPLGDVEGSMQTPDGRWRVEIVRRRGGVWWYRIVHGEEVLDRLSIAAVERILDEAGVERHTLVEIDPDSTTERNGMTTDRAPRLSGDDGFSLLEVLVALAVIGIVMAGAAPFLIKSVALVGQQRSQQIAIEVANDALERARALSPSSLLAGRGLTAVQNQLNAAPAAVRSLTSEFTIDADSTLTSVTDLLAGANAALPTDPKPVTVGGVEYRQSWYVGRCWQTKADSTLVNTALGNCLATQPTGIGVIAVPFFRIVVAVTWQHNGCAANQCVYVTSTLVSPNPDPVFDLKRPPPKIAAPGDGTNYVGDTVSFQLVATGGTLPRTWTVVGLPTGLTPTGTGLISGNPTTPGTYTVAAHVRDRDGNSDDATFTWTVAALPALTSPGARVFRTSTAVTLPVTLTGGMQPVTWTAGGLPAGLTINASTGVISGTTPATVQTTQQTATITVVDKGLKTATTTFTWQVVTPVTLGSPGPQTANKGDTVTYAFGALAGGGLTPYTWTATGLPPGLSLNTSTGMVSGTIGAGTRYLVAINVTDSAGGTAAIVVPLNVTVSSSLRVTAPNPASPDRTSTVGSTVSLSASALPASGQVWSATGLPPGLSINSSSGTVSGKPTTAGTYVTTLTVNASSQVANLMFNWTVTP